MDVVGFRGRVLAEVHDSRYVVHLRFTKMYHDIKEMYWLNSVKKDVANFKAKYSVCIKCKLST